MATPIPNNHTAFSLAELSSITQGEVLVTAGQKPDVAAAHVSGIVTDTRVPLLGSLFVALKGERFDAHDYLEQAVCSGASALLVERARLNLVKAAARAVPTIVVESTVAALGQLAQAHRKRWAGKVIAVAGSAGKTTTRSICTALAEKLWPGQVHSTVGNLNNQIGLPMVLFGLTDAHSVAIVELGTNQPGEVSKLCSIAQPDCSVLTLIDLEHSEGLGGLDDIELEEAAIFEGSPLLAVGNADDDRVVRRLRASDAGKKLTYGFREGADYRVFASPPRSTLRTSVEINRPDGSKFGFDSPFLGRPGASSVAAGVAVAETLAERRLTSEQVSQALTATSARQSGRLQPVRLNDEILVIDDSYNANPTSMRSALAVALDLAVARRAKLHLVLGEMGELGVYSQREHQALAVTIAHTRPDSVIAVTGDARYFLTEVAPGVGHFVNDAHAALDVVKRLVAAGDIVLAKGSRSVGLDRVVQGLVSLRGAA